MQGSKAGCIDLTYTLTCLMLLCSAYVQAVLFDLCGRVDERPASESAVGDYVHAVHIIYGIMLNIQAVQLRVSRACEQALKFFEILLAAVPSFPTV